MYLHRSAVFAVACESRLTVFDINGRLIADMDLKTHHNTGEKLSMAFIFIYQPFLTCNHFNCDAGSISCVRVLDCSEATSRDRMCVSF